MTNHSLVARTQLEQEIQRREHYQEEYDCAHMTLDDLGIPRDDGLGNVYSLVGRINILAAANTPSDGGAIAKQTKS